MTQSSIRAKVGIFLILAQFGVLVYAGVIFSRDHMDYDTLTTTIGIILPMFAVHTTAIAKYFTAHMDDVEDTSPKVNGPFATLAFLVPVLFVAYLCTVLALRSNGTALVESNQFKWALGLGETVFGAYLATFLGSLFAYKPEHQDAGVAAGAAGH